MVLTGLHRCRLGVTRQGLAVDSGLCPEGQESHGLGGAGRAEPLGPGRCVADMNVDRLQMTDVAVSMDADAPSAVSAAVRTK